MDSANVMKDFAEAIQKFDKPFKFSTRSLFHLQKLEFTASYLFDSLVEGEEETREGLPNVNQLEQVSEDTSFFDVLGKLRSTYCFLCCEMNC